MTDHVALVKAELRELKPSGEEVPDSRVPVQFNPESMKVSFANQVVPPDNAAATDTRSTSAIQYVGKGTTKLSVQLWFDVTAVLPEGATGVRDVRELTKKIAYFITPKAVENDQTKQVPPGVRFLWGTFQFDGIMDALEESLEFFSPEGKPLRASVTLSLSQQRIEFAFAKQPGGVPGGGGTPVGTKPLIPAPAGATLQGLADANGKGGNWQAIAEANGIENPRRLAPGQLVDLNVRVPRRIGVS
jgi:hypothetical protein